MSSPHGKSVSLPIDTILFCIRIHYTFRYAWSLVSRTLRAPAGAQVTMSVNVTGVTPGGIIAAAVSGTPALGRPDYRAVLLINEATSGSPLSVTAELTGVPSPSTWQRFAYNPATPPTDNLPIGPSGTLPAGTMVISDSLSPRSVVVWATTWDEAPVIARS